MPTCVPRTSPRAWQHNIHIMNSAGATNVEDEANVLPGLGDEAVSLPVDKDRPIEDD